MFSPGTVGLMIGLSNVKYFGLFTGNRRSQIMTNQSSSPSTSGGANVKYFRETYSGIFYEFRMFNALWPFKSRNPFGRVKLGCFAKQGGIACPLVRG